MKFKELKIKTEILKSLEEMKFDEMMPIQEKAIPVILAGKNIIGEAATGTGKTAAFLIPILHNIDLYSDQVEAIIVTPTRELALQIENEIKKIGKYLDIKYVTLVGGMSIEDQSKKLRRKPSIIIGTLGRIHDHIRSKRLDLSKVRYFILDEADEMLKEGFKEDITAINNEMPKSKQTLLFSATYSKTILSLSKDLMETYEYVSVKNKEQQSINIDQYYLIMKEKNKFSNLLKLLDVDRPKSAIIFGRTKRRADELNEALIQCGYKSTCIHGDLSQGQRNIVMRNFRKGDISILVATDVAARGIDISSISHVYNFDLPQEVEFYTHRVGRTGRANEYGISYSFIKESELSHIKRIEKETNVRIIEKEVPTSEEVAKARRIELIEKLEEKLKNLNMKKTEELATELIKEFGEVELVSILIDSMEKRNFNDITLTGEPGVRIKRNGQDRSQSRARNYIAERNIRNRKQRRNSNYSNKSHRRTGNRNK